MSEHSSNYKCSCGTGDGTGDYIQCDNETCTVGWYHWECVQVTEVIAGTWLCPSCSPSAAFYIKQLAKKTAVFSPAPKVEKTDGSATSKRAKQERAHEPVLESKKKDIANKGIAVKKPAAKKPKPKWLGWVELSSDGEEDFKKRVDAQWGTDDAVLGKRTRASKAVGEEDEPGSPRLRRHSRLGGKRVVETDSDEEEEMSLYREEDRQQQEPEKELEQEVVENPEESVYQEEEAEEKAPVHWRASIVEISSDSSNDSEDTMDVDRGPRDTENQSIDESSDPSSDFMEDVQTTSIRDGKKTVVEAETENPEDSMDMEIQDGSPEATGRDSSDGSEYVDDDSSSASAEIPANASNNREVADSQSPPPSTNSAGATVISPILQVSDPATQHEDVIEVSTDDEGQQDQESVSTPEIVDFATRYKRQGNCWGEFPESAIRSTLPRLGGDF